MLTRYAFFLGFRFSLFFGLLSPMRCLLTGNGEPGEPRIRAGLMSVNLCRHYTFLAETRPHRNLRRLFPQVADHRATQLWAAPLRRPAAAARPQAAALALRE